MPPEPESKFYNLAQARIADGLHCPSSSPVSSVVPAALLTIKSPLLNLREMNMKFLTEFRNKIVAGGRKGGLSKSPKKSAGQLRRWEEHRAKSILKPCK